MSFSQIPLEPKRPGPLRVLTIGRVSDLRQNESNIDAMHDVVERVLVDMCKGDFVLDKLGEQGSGLIVDRPSIVEESVGSRRACTMS